MKKSFFLVALTATLLVASLAVGQTSNQCQGGANVQFLGVGSSAQTNALAYAATALVAANHVGGNNGAYGLITFKTSTIVDNRGTGVQDTGLTTWVAWDPSTTSNNKCDAYIYFQTDSGVGVKNFFAYEKYTGTTGVNLNKHFTSVAAAYASLPALPIAPGTNAVPGLPDVSNDPNGLPSNLWSVIKTKPEDYVNGGNALPEPWCGNVSTVISTSQYWCYFNAAGTDIRPEDALYATTRALTSYNGIVPPLTHGGTLTGFGYGTTSTGAGGCTPQTVGLIGCPFLDSFGNGTTTSNATFNVVKFALSGADPIKSGTLPSYTTLSVGAAPMMVIAGNEDSANLGQTFNDGTATNYTYNNVNKQVLAQLFSGYSTCVADLSPAGADGTSTTNNVPLQIIHRESLSGTYNTFEFTAVRTQSGGPLLSTATPNANADSGQEQFNDPNVFPGTTGCTYGDGVTTNPKIPQANCFDPMFLSSTSGTSLKAGQGCQGGGSTGIPVRLRAIGTGEEVKAVIGTFNTPVSGLGPGLATVVNPLGYAFWSYGNLDPTCSTLNSGATTCAGHFLAHYLTVDSIDPLFATPGGEFDPTPNPSGPYNAPVCKPTGGQACPTINFPHIKDGTYPLWSLLRTVTFAPVAGKVTTPTGVLDVIANEEKTSAVGSLSDYVPFLNTITGSNGVYTGNLNLFVFRSHFKPTGILVQNNGHSGCAGGTTFTGISLQGGTSAQKTCLVDFGGDVGGSVLTVQSDMDFLHDYSTEEYGLRQ